MDETGKFPDPSGKFLINQFGNVDDIRNTIKLGKYSLEDFEAALFNEEYARQAPRKSVIKLLEANIKKLKK